MIAKTTKPRQNPWDHESNTPWRDYLPVHWGIRRLRTVVEMRVSNVDKHTNDDEIPVRLCNYVDVYYNDQIDGNLPYMKATVSPAEADRFRLKQNDVIITKDSEEWNDIAVPALVADAPNDLVCGYHLAILRPSSAINGAYLARALQIPPIAHQFHVEAQGITRYGLTHDDILSASIPLPPLEEQAAIVRYIDHADELINRYISAKERLITLLEEQRQAVIHQAVTRGLDPAVPSKPSGIPWLGDVPAHWELSRTKNEFQSLNYRRVPLSATERGSMTLRQYDYYGASGVIDKVDSYLFHDDLLLIAEDGANLVLRNSPLAIIARGKYWVNNHAHILKPRRGNLDFLAAVMEGINYTPWISGAAQPKLTSDRLMGIPIVVPTRAEQDAIMNRTKKWTSPMTTAIDHTKRQLTLIEEYRIRLIADAVTGQLDVRQAEATLPKPSALDAPVD